MRLAKLIAVATIVFAVAAAGAVAGIAVADDDAPRTEDVAAPAAAARAAADASSAHLGYVPITPCRIVDTRLGWGKLGVGPSGETRLVETQDDLSAQGGAAAGCDIPESATGLSAVVFSDQAEGNGYVRVYAAGTEEPRATIMGYQPGWLPSNTANIPLDDVGSGPQFNLKVYGPPTHMIIDVFGYYHEPYHVVVDAAGTVFSNSGSSGVVQNGTGDWTVTWQRQVSPDCVPIATSFDLDRTVNAFRSGNQVLVNTYDNAGTAANAGFYLVLVC